MLAMRQILLGPRSAPTPPLPYDYAVEYVQLTCANRSGSATGVDFGCENEFLGLDISNAHVRVEAVCSIYGSGKCGVLIFGVNGLIIGGNARLRSRNFNSGDDASIEGGVVISDSEDRIYCSSIEDYKACVTTIDEGLFRLYADGVKIGSDFNWTSPITGANKLYRYQNNSAHNDEPQANTWVGLWGGTFTGETTKVCRCKGVKCYLGDRLIVDGAPCVKDDTVGWYNSVDGSLRMISMADHPEYSAGPRI